MSHSELLKISGEINYGELFNFGKGVNFKLYDDGENDNVTGDTDLGTGELNGNDLVDWLINPTADPPPATPTTPETPATPTTPA